MEINQRKYRDTETNQPTSQDRKRKKERKKEQIYKYKKEEEEEESVRDGMNIDVADYQFKLRAEFPPPTTSPARPVRIQIEKITGWFISLFDLFISNIYRLLFALLSSPLSLISLISLDVVVDVVVVAVVVAPAAPLAWEPIHAFQKSIPSRKCWR